MCKKLMFLISLVSVLVLAGSGFATDFTWEGESPYSQLWCDPLNWDPVEAYGPDGCDDKAFIPSVGANPTVIITAIEVGEIGGPAWESGELGDHEILLVEDANLTVCGHWKVQKTNPYTAYITLQDNARVSIGDRFYAHGDDQRVVIDLSDNAVFLVTNDLRAGDGDGDYFELNMSGSAYLYAGNDDDGFRQNEGELHITLSGNAILEAEYIRWRSKSEGITSTLDISENAQFLVTDDNWEFSGGSGLFIATLSDNAAIIVDGDLRGGEDNDFDTEYLIDMTCGGSQLIDIGGNMTLIDDDDADGFAQINLHGGTIIVGDELKSETDNWNIDICCNGMMVLNGNVVGDILDWYDSGNITVCGFGPCGGPGDLVVDYNGVDDETTVSVDMDPNRAYDPDPECDAVDVPCDVCLSWTAGANAEQHFVYLHTDINKLTTPGDHSALVAILPAEQTTYCPEATTLSLTYYWRVDEVWDCGTATGQVWSFTKTHCMTIDDFESYTDDDVDPDQVFYTWLDGAGDAGGQGGNGTGSSVYLVHDPVHCGENAMEYQYDSSGSEREMAYSEAERAFDPPLNFTDQGEKVLAIWFYGDPANIVDEEPSDADVMWFEVGDTSDNVARTPYGIYAPDTPSDIQSAGWNVWVMDLATEFPGVELALVDSMAIGFGQYGRPKEQGINQSGTVFFDCLQVCEPICVDERLGRRRYAPDGDVNHDCCVNWDDLKIIGDNWLEDRR